MAKSWKDIRSQAVRDGLLNEKMVEEYKVRMLAEVRAHKLASISTAYGSKRYTG